MPQNTTNQLTNQSSIWFADGTQTGTTISGPSWPRSNDDDGVTQYFKALEFDPHHRIQSSVLPRTLSFRDWF